MNIYNTKLHKCLIINITFISNNYFNSDVYELINLIKATDWNISIIETISMKRLVPDPKFFCGSGKIAEIKKIIENKSINIIIINHSITAVQERNIANILNCKIIDRTRLILEIFSQRAYTNEGKLQVKLAKLNYESTRLVRSWTHLERQKSVFGLRGGPGEKQLEIDKRIIKKKIYKLEEKLKKVKNKRNLSRSYRKKNNIPTVALVGYTNAGKSSLFNKLSNSHVTVKDQLFVTLDPTMRKINIPNFGPLILSDTVGFIRNLPYHIIQAFHATLEEVMSADLILHIIDYSDTNYLKLMNDVQLILKEINIDNKPIINIFNKIDKKSNCKHNDNNSTIYLSAKNGTGINNLYKIIADNIDIEWVEKILIFPTKYYKIRSQLYDMGIIKKETITKDNKFKISIKISKSDLEKINSKNKLELIAKFSQH